MASDRIEQIIFDVQSICPAADPNLARLWVRNAARRTMEAKQWSWNLRRGHWVLAAPVTNVSSGQTVTVTADSDEITFSGAVATEAMVGRQFRVSTSNPLYDIVGYVSATKLRIFPAWGESTAAAQGFTISNSRVSLPNDCSELLTVVSPLNKWQLWLNVPQEVLDGDDPARTRGTGNPSVLSPLDYGSVFSGSVSAATLASGSGTKPITSGEYVGPSDALYTVQVTTGGIGGVAVFKWKKDEGAFTTGVLSDASSGNMLSDGVTVLWPASSTFTLNDIFVVRATAGRTVGAPRLEVYPSPSATTVLSYLYIVRYPDLTDDGVDIPGALAARTDIILEKALEFAAAYTGTEDSPNPYTQINRRDYHAANWLLQVGELARQDNALFQRNVLPAQRLSFAPWPFYGGRDLQEYDPYWAGPSDIPW